jgi:sec-independent protein translocase protein TatB
VFDINPLEMVALVILAIILFGPDRLPKVAADAGRMLRQFREFTQTARADLSRELGPEFRDLNLEDLNPRTLARKNLLGNGSLLDDNFDLGELPVTRTRSQDRLQAGELPPYDPETT